MVCTNLHYICGFPKHCTPVQRFKYGFGVTIPLNNEETCENEGFDDEEALGVDAARVDERSCDVEMILEGAMEDAVEEATEEMTALGEEPRPWNKELTMSRAYDKTKLMDS